MSTYGKYTVFAAQTFGGTGAFETGTIPTDGTPFYASYAYSAGSLGGGSNRFRVNGVNMTNDNTSGYDNGQGATVGQPTRLVVGGFLNPGISPGKWDGLIAEILAYSGTHDLTTTQQIESYLVGKYGL